MPEGLTEHEFIELLTQQSGKLHRISWAILGSESEAWDALQEASLSGLQNRHKLRGGAAAFATWMKHIVVNQCRDMLERRQRVVPMAPGDLPEPPALPSLEGTAAELDLWEAVSQLGQLHREVVFLYYLADLDVSEIADALGIAEGTVKSRLHRAREQLRSKLEPAESESH